jgi:hypothetical protein
MAMWQGVGGLTTIAAGATQYWEYSYPQTGGVGATVAAPNFLQEQINVELVTSQPGVVQRDQGADNPPLIVYTVRVSNLGATDVSYNLNVGDWQ